MKAYRLMCLEIKKIIKFKDVVFMKDSGRNTTRRTRKNDYGHMTTYDYWIHGTHVEPT